MRKQSKNLPLKEQFSHSHSGQNPILHPQVMTSDSVSSRRRASREPLYRCYLPPMHWPLLLKGWLLATKWWRQTVIQNPAVAKRTLASDSGHCSQRVAQNHTQEWHIGIGECAACFPQNPVLTGAPMTESCSHQMNLEPCPSKCYLNISAVLFYILKIISEKMVPILMYCLLDEHAHSPIINKRLFYSDQCCVPHLHSPRAAGFHFGYLILCKPCWQTSHAQRNSLIHAPWWVFTLCEPGETHCTVWCFSFRTTPTLSNCLRALMKGK